MPNEDATLASFSAALCRGLIEAVETPARPARKNRRFPRLYAAASLKRLPLQRRAVRAALGFPRLYAAASLKRNVLRRVNRQLKTGFPRLYAAASLKRVSSRVMMPSQKAFSAALCRGLIEAPPVGRPCAGWRRRFPRLYAAASLKQGRELHGVRPRAGVFRGFMPRPH